MSRPARALRPLDRTSIWIGLLVVAASLMSCPVRANPFYETFTGREISEAARSIFDARDTIEAFNEQVQAARVAYFEAKRAGDIPEATAHGFDDALAAKDFTVFTFDIANLFSQGQSDIYAKLLPEIDGGIPAAARPARQQWSNSLIETMYVLAKQDGIGALEFIGAWPAYMKPASATEENQELLATYLEKRNAAESVRYEKWLENEKRLEAQKIERERRKTANDSERFADPLEYLKAAVNAKDYADWTETVPEEGLREIGSRLQQVTQYQDGFGFNFTFRAPSFKALVDEYGDTFPDSPRFIERAMEGSCSGVHVWAKQLVLIYGKDLDYYRQQVEEAKEANFADRYEDPMEYLQAVTWGPKEYENWMRDFPADDLKAIALRLKQVRHFPRAWDYKNWEWSTLYSVSLDVECPAYQAMVKQYADYLPRHFLPRNLRHQPSAPGANRWVEALAENWDRIPHSK